MNPRTLSSALTFWMKCLFPAIWISMFGSATLALFLSAMHDHSDPSAPEWMKWQFLAMWIAGSVFILWGCAGLKKVRMDESGLLVSNFVKEVRIPFADICDVTENRWINIHPVTVHLRRPSPFGERIVFMPHMRLFGWSSHPVVSELRALAKI